MEQVIQVIAVFSFLSATASLLLSVFVDKEDMVATWVIGFCTMSSIIVLVASAVLCTIFYLS